MVGAFVLHSINSSQTESLHNDVKKTWDNLHAIRSDYDSSKPEIMTKLNQLRAESSVLTERINELESALGQANTKKVERDVTKSELAVQRANAAKHESMANAVVRDLGKLKSLQVEWTALESALQHESAGSRIAGSAKHLERFVEILHQVRPTAEQIVEWESQLNPLMEPFTQAAPESPPVVITEEHAQLLSDLGKELSTQVAEFQRQKLLLESIQRETSALEPINLKLADAIEQHGVERERAETDRLAHVRETARAEAEKAADDRIAKAEQELTNERVEQKEQEIAREKERVAAEGRLNALKQKATAADLAEKATREADGLRWAQLEREMQRDMNEIKGLLMAYTSPGFT
ncbi:MAG TPA: hypothetical protein PK992_08085, partial [Planctomycetaceae bacterium]|nr:hypothetical protein [Planctomycetaceae bacterium]